MGFSSGQKEEKVLTVITFTEKNLKEIKEKKMDING